MNLQPFSIALGCRYTTDSRAYNIHSSTLPSTANVAFLAALHAADIRAKGQSSQARPYNCWAQSQAQYMLGNHPGGRWVRDCSRTRNV